MKVLWITNILFPEIAAFIGKEIPVSGGWMYSSAKALLDNNTSVELSVATVYSGSSLIVKKINNINYYCLPHEENITKYSVNLEDNWKIIKKELNPNVVHIHGSEYSHGLAYINACGNKNVVLSIQGLVGVYARYSLAGINRIDLLKSLTISDIKNLNFLFLEQIKMEKRGLLENRYFKKIEHVIGRTSWDKSHALAINSKLKYHFCNETLRSVYYKKNWVLEDCERNTIFLSQGAKPIKGIHILIKALPFILKHYPDTKVYVAGRDFINIWNKSTYGSYISKLLRKYKLKSYFHFTGNLHEKEMCNQFLKSHVFVCPSSIENSPNSVGEAQLLGVPCIASYVGGIPDMVENNETGLLYRFEEHEMLADSICQVFSNDNLANNISKNSKKIALSRHHIVNNSKVLFDIYKEKMKI